MGNVLQFVLAADNSNMSRALTQTNSEMARLESATTAGANKMAQAFEKVGLSDQKLRAELNLLSEAVGGQLGQLGALADVAFNPWMLAIAGVVEAFKLLSEQAGQTNERIAAVISLQSSHAEHAYEAQSEAMSETTAKINAFYRSLQNADSAQDVLSENMALEVQQYQEMAESLKSVNDMREKNTDAAIDYAQAIGQISDAQARQLKFDAQNNKAEQDSAATQNEFAQEIAAKQKRRQQALAGVGAAKEEVFQKAMGSEKNRQAIHLQEADLADEKEVLQKFKKARDEAAAKNKAGGFINAIYALPGGGTRKVAGDAEELYKTQLGTVQKMEDGLRIKKENAREDDAALERAKQKGLHEDATARKLDQEIKSIRQKAAAQKQVDADKLAAAKQAQAIEIATAQAKSIADVSKNFAPTSFEKMGFHFGGGGPTLFSDHAAQTAKNTARMAAGIDALVRAVAGNSGLSTDDVRLLGFTQ